MVLTVWMKTISYYYTGYSLWSKDLCLCLAFDLIIYRWLAQPYLIGGHNDNIVSGVDYSEFNSGRDTNDDGGQQHWGHQCCTLGLSGQHQPYQEEVKSLGRSYRIELWHVHFTYHVLYLQCIIMRLLSLNIEPYVILLLVNYKTFLSKNWVHHLITCLLRLLLLTKSLAYTLFFHL